MNNKCKDCRWYAAGGNCHRYPPQMVLFPCGNQHPIMYATNARFPWVDADGWCGEFAHSFGKPEKF